jgi:hypothetical protein
MPPNQRRFAQGSGLSRVDPEACSQRGADLETDHWQLDSSDRATTAEPIRVRRPVHACELSGPRLQSLHHCAPCSPPQHLLFLTR